MQQKLLDIFGISLWFPALSKVFGHIGWLLYLTSACLDEWPRVAVNATLVGLIGVMKRNISNFLNLDTTHEEIPVAKCREWHVNSKEKDKISLQDSFSGGFHSAVAEHSYTGFLEADVAMFGFAVKLEFTLVLMYHSLSRNKFSWQKSSTVAFDRFEQVQPPQHFSLVVF